MNKNKDKKRYQRPETVSLCLNTENVMYATSVPVGDGDGPGTADARDFFLFDDNESELVQEVWDRY